MTQNSNSEHAKLQRSFPKAVLRREQPSLALPSCEREAFAQTSSLTNADGAFLKLLAAVELNRGRSVATICGARTRYRGVSKSVSAQFRWLAVPSGNTLNELRHAEFLNARSVLNLSQNRVFRRTPDRDEFFR
jgi:hypothetical protein